MNWCEVNIFLLGNILIHGNVTNFFLVNCSLSDYTHYTQPQIQNNTCTDNVLSSSYIF